MNRRKIVQYIEAERLFGRQDKILVALSGGADSVALLHLLLDIGYTCEAAHCNFHLRGDESDRDEIFVRQLCTQLKTPLHIRHFDTAEKAAREHISIEMAARELRYAWFEELRLQQGADAIAVAHHKDDSVETVLLNLIRGTGINGLTESDLKTGRLFAHCYASTGKRLQNICKKLDKITSPTALTCKMNIRATRSGSICFRLCKASIRR